MKQQVIDIIDRLTENSGSLVRAEVTFATQSEAETYLYNSVNYEKVTSTPYNEENYNLQKFKRFLETLGNPHHELNCIHIAGTKGKGATSAIVASVLSAHGYQTGLFSSPHLIDIKERFRIDGKAMTTQEFLAEVSCLSKMTNQLKFSNGYRTTFELMTAIAFRFFRKQNLDWVVLEVGMGGRLDCTNVVTPQITAITRLDLDHTDSLGNSIESIAREKAGISKKNVDMVLGDQLSQVDYLIESLSEKAGSTVIRSKDSIKINNVKLSEQGLAFSVEMTRHKLDCVETDFNALYQIENCQTALAILDRLEDQGKVKLNQINIRKGLKQIRWPGRFTIIEDGSVGNITCNCPVVIDGAHNPRAIQAVKNSLSFRYPDNRVLSIVSLPSNKDVEGYLKILSSFSQFLILTKYKNARSAQPETLKDLARQYFQTVWVTDNIDEALMKVNGCVRSKDLVLITGSIYLAGEVLALANMEETCLNIY